MLFQSVLLLFFGACLAVNVRQSKSCSDNELGPPQEVQAIPDDVLLVTWKPPTYFESCEMEYKLHIQNMNTSEYLAPIQELTDLSFEFDYIQADHICIHLRATVYANYGTEVSPPAWGVTFLSPLIEIGPPANLNIQNTEEYLKLKWTTPEGFQKCYYYFMFVVQISAKDGGDSIIHSNVAGYEFNIPYYNDDNPFYCKEVVIDIQAYFKGSAGQTTTETMIFGPPGHCESS